jgi:hypothetical protein
MGRREVAELFVYTLCDTRLWNVVTGYSCRSTASHPGPSRAHHEVTVR